MKRGILLLFFTLLPVFFLTAQTQQQEEELLPPKRSSASKIGGAGGFTPFYLFLDINPINEILKRTNSAEFDNGRMFLYGGQGYAYILFVNNLRLGGLGASGSLKSRSLSGSTRRDVDLSVSFGGVTLEYVVPVLPRLDFTFGVLLGGGGMDLNITRDDGRAKVWDDLWNEYGSLQTAQEYSRRLSGSFFIYQPSANVEFALLRWLGFRAGVSYLGMAGGEWKLDDKYDVFGVPSNISGRGWMINTGVFLGTFLY